MASLSKFTTLSLNDLAFGSAIVGPPGLVMYWEHRRQQKSCAFFQNLVKQSEADPEMMLASRKYDKIFDKSLDELGPFPKDSPEETWQIIKHAEKITAQKIATAKKMAAKKMAAAQKMATESTP